MEKRRKAIVIFLYNIFALFLAPALLYLSRYSTVEANYQSLRVRTFPFIIALSLIMIPEVRCRLRWRLDRTISSRIFILICSLAIGRVLYMIVHYYFVTRFQAPKSYYASCFIIVVELIWVVVLEFYLPLSDHLLKFGSRFPEISWLMPNADDETVNKIWHAFYVFLIVVVLLYDIVFT